MGFSYNVNVLNQKGSPAIYTDTFANRPSPGYAGRLFVSSDTSAIYEDTGTAWTLIANVSSGAGTLQQVTTNGNTSNVGISITAGGLSTNSLTDTALTSGSVTFAGSGGLISQDNANLFWDDTNNRLGINTNTPGNSLDVHTSDTTPMLALNNTAGSQSAISFLNTSSAKWRIGNTATDTFDIYNFSLSANAISIDNAINTVKFDQYLLIRQGLLSNFISGYNSIGGNSTGFYLQLGTSTNTAYLDMSSLSAARSFTFPNASGTLALTSNLTSYLPLTGGNLTGALSIGVTSGNIALSINNTSLSAKSWILIPTTNGTETNLDLYYSSTVGGGTKVTFANNGNVGIGTSSPSEKLSVEGRININSGNALYLSNGDNTATSAIVNGESTSTSSTLFYTGGAERVRITSGGDVYVGASSFTSPNGADRFIGVFGGQDCSLILQDSVQTWELYVNDDFYITRGATTALQISRTSSAASFSGSVDGPQFTTNAGGVFKLFNDTNTNYWYTRCLVASSNNYRFNYNGVDKAEINNSTGAFVPLSDINKKKDFEDSTIGLNAILGLKPTLFRMLDEEDTNKHLGFIAQEVKEFIPQAYVESGEGENTFIGLDYQAISSALVKAVQEQQTIINGLLQRIEFLENK